MLVFLKEKDFKFLKKKLLIIWTQPFQKLWWCQTWITPETYLCQLRVYIPFYVLKHKFSVILQRNMNIELILRIILSLSLMQKKFKVTCNF